MTLRLQRTRSRGRCLRAALDVCLTCWALLVAAGCGGGRAGYRSQEADELRFQNSRREEELKKAEEVVRLLKGQVAALASERDALLGQVVELKTQVRAQRQGMDQLEADRGAAEERIRQAAERSEDLKKTLERATSLLGLVGDEVASLRVALRGMETGTRRPGGQAEDLDFIEKSALLSAKIEQLHFEILRERALLGAFSRPRASPTGQPSSREPVSEPEVAPSPPPVTRTTATPLPRPRTEPKEEVRADGTTPDGALPEPGILAKVGGALKAAWQAIPLKHVERLLQIALLAGGVAIGLITVIFLGRRLSRRIRAAASGLVGSLRRRHPQELDIEDEPEAEESTGAKEDLEAAPMEPVESARDAGRKPAAENLEGLAGEPAGAGRAPVETDDPEAAATPVIAESADFFQAFTKPEKAIADGPPPRPPRPAPLAGDPAVVKPTRPRREPRRPVAPPPPAPAVHAESLGGIRGEATEPEATQAIEPVDVEPGPGEGTFTQVIPEVDQTEWNATTQELPEHGPEEFKHTQVISHESKEDFLSTQVIPAVPEVEGPRPRELFPSAREADMETAPTQVIKEPEGLKGREWPAQKGKGAGAKQPQRVERRAAARKQPPSDKDLLAELEELIGRKIDETR